MNHEFGEGHTSAAARLKYAMDGTGLAKAYYEGREDQLSALGLRLNCVVLWNTGYLDHALSVLRGHGYPVPDADVARLSAFIRAHLGLEGHHSFVLPDLDGRPWPLRAPATPDDR
ncbi:transposase [Nocardia sputi]|uniref:transposase n=1 Tax=Nocardia sputi TaxID=2943705 RepID=UPI0020C10E5C|nr:transposase [Nocardia sputi]